eukprot:TRINITY_DN20261_c0_g1_i2.p1 TRINITY_DN20261_c0_g1~~TRINITY_DN20261_c0_g1_i2.p1  ORF type:complete len:781 (-),score=150.09 TRINITY_DN20261_c0_g1_i2:411-2753(-)
MEVLTESLRLFSSLNPFRLSSSSDSIKDSKSDESAGDSRFFSTSSDGILSRERVLSASRDPSSAGLQNSKFDSVNHSDDNVSHSNVLLSAENAPSKQEHSHRVKDDSEELHTIQKRFLDAANLLGEASDNLIIPQVLHRLNLAEQIKHGQNNKRVSISSNKVSAANQNDLEFTCTVLVLGKTGVGKSATINSIFGEARSTTDAFTPATKKVKEIMGSLNGLRLRVIDTPGLLPSSTEYHKNRKILSSVKNFIRKIPPDVVLFVDRLDIPNGDTSDFPLIKVITDMFGIPIWYNSFLVLTHSSSISSARPYEYQVRYETFVAQRVNCIESLICKAARDMRLKIPFSLVENHRLFQNLPAGLAWKPKLLLQCFAFKAINEADAVLKCQDIRDKIASSQHRVAPLPAFLSLLIQSREQTKIQDEGHITRYDIDDFDYISDSDDVDEFDLLPPFKRLTKSQLRELSKEQKKDYFDELNYRENLFHKKQLREEYGRLKSENSERQRHADEPAVPGESTTDNMLEMPMPPTFECDDSSYRYRCIEKDNQLLIRPMYNLNGWDHDCGFEGVSVQKILAIDNRHPMKILGQFSKDKSYSDFQVESSASYKHQEGRVSVVQFDVNKMEKDYAYTLFGETRIRNLEQNVTAGGFACMIVRHALFAGLKLEDTLKLGKMLQLTLHGAAALGQGDMARGGSLEVTLRNRDYSGGKMMAKLGISILDWKQNLILEGNFLSEFCLGNGLTLSTCIKVNNNANGQIGFRAKSSGDLHVALVGLIPILKAVTASLC